MLHRRPRTPSLIEEEGVRAAYAAHGGELYRFALRTLGDAGLAQDAVQETFLRAWRARDRYDPAVAALEIERRVALLGALERLSEEHRLVVTYRYLLEMDEPETAAALGWPRGTVKSRLSRALRKLSRLLPECEPGEALGRKGRGGEGRA